MTILFDATRKAKPAGRPQSRRFGAGLLAYVPSTRLPYSFADEAEYARRKADMDQARRDFDTHLEARYARFLDSDRISRGVSGC